MTVSPEPYDGVAVTNQSADGVYFGMMSGTSLDGVDAVAVEFRAGLAPRTLAHAARPLPAPLKETLFALQTPGQNEIARAAQAANQLAVLYAECCSDLRVATGLASADVKAIGAHGQTIRHRPELGYTQQLNNPALLAELTHIDVIADFRSRDVAAGGQGAPLVPACHAVLFGDPGRTRVICNLGGISNISVLGADGSVRGFDCGPANALLDHWAHRHTGLSYDADGALARQGTVHPGLLAALMHEPYFDLAPPKSTGRDLFNPAWLDARLAGFAGLAPADVQATLTALSALAIARDVERHAPACRGLFVCGGGAYNMALLDQLRAALDDTGLRISVDTTDALGVPPLQVEGVAFAWLAYRFNARLPGNLPTVTGADGLRVLGALYPR